MIDDLENASKPVVAAIHGVAAGGGLELALGCHYRVASPQSRVGLPEVTLGFVPGAGGTQRLPRLIGVQRALEMIVNGRLLPAEQAHAWGLIDEIMDGDLVANAVRFARGRVGRSDAIRKTRELEDGLSDARTHPEIFDDFRAGMARRARGYEAPYACIDCIEAAVTLPFSEGLQKERDTFQRLVASDQSKAQRHVFFAERPAARIPDVPKHTPTVPITTAAVIGCGTMGGGISMSFANAGIPVTIVEANQDGLDRGIDIIRQNYAATASKGRLSQAAMDERMALITPTTHYDDVGQADLVVEAVFEDLDLKRQVFAILDAVCQPTAILATNTSTLDVN